MLRFTNKLGFLILGFVWVFASAEDALKTHPSSIDTGSQYEEEFIDTRLIYTNTISKCNDTQPMLTIGLNYFKVIEEIEAIKLEWQTLSELNTTYFDIEKSGDAIHFYSIGKVEGSGLSSEPINYTFYDSNIDDTSYYRLKINYLDSNSEYSKIILCKMKDHGSVNNLKFHPNPAKDFITIHSGCLSNEQIKIYILDNLGNAVDAFNFDRINKVIDVNQYDRGMYLLQYQINGTIKTERIIVN